MLVTERLLFIDPMFNDGIELEPVEDIEDVNDEDDRELTVATAIAAAAANGDSR